MSCTRTPHPSEVDLAPTPMRIAKSYFDARPTDCIWLFRHNTVTIQELLTTWQQTKVTISDILRCLRLKNVFSFQYFPHFHAGASISIYRWRQMRHGQFWGESIKSLVLSFNIQKCDFCPQILIHLLYIVFLSFSQKFSRSLRSLDCVYTPLRNESMQCALPTLFIYFLSHYLWRTASKIHWKHA